MSAYSYDALRRHEGHTISCLRYGTDDSTMAMLPINIALECETCDELLLDYDHPDPKIIAREEGR